MTAGGKNVAPAVLEDRLRTHWLISQAWSSATAGRSSAADHDRPRGVRAVEGAGRQARRRDRGRPARRPGTAGRDPGSGRRRQQGGLPGRVDQEVPILDVDFTEEGGHLSAKLGIKRSVSPRSARARSTRCTRNGVGGVRGVDEGRRRAAVWSQHQSRSTQARPFSPMVLAASGLESRATRRSDTADVPAVDHVAGLALEDRVGGAAGVAADDREAGRRGLEVDDAQAFDVEAAAPGAAGHREDVARGVVGREFRLRDPAGEEHGGSQSGPFDQMFQVLAVRTRADDEQRRVRDCLMTSGQARMSVSWPLRRTSRETQTTTRRSVRRYRSLIASRAAGSGRNAAASTPGGAGQSRRRGRVSARASRPGCTRRDR